jgi:hypothetical protein
MKYVNMHCQGHDSMNNLQLDSPSVGSYSLRKRWHMNWTVRAIINNTGYSNSHTTILSVPHSSNCRVCMHVVQRKPEGRKLGVFDENVPDLPTPASPRTATLKLPSLKGQLERRLRPCRFLLDSFFSIVIISLIVRVQVQIQVTQQPTVFYRRSVSNDLRN